MGSVGRLYSLRSVLTLSLLGKFSIFLIGVALVGLTSTRGELSSCGTSASSFPFYSAPLADIEAYSDFRDLYLKCLVNPFLAGANAYHLPIVYNYPPLFLYTLAIFALGNIAWYPAVPLVLCDALTVIPLYLIAKEFIFSGNSKAAFAVSLLWIFNPINLFYNDFIWLNPGPTTFFLVLGIYFFLKQKWVISSIVFAVSTGFKQTAVLIFPVIVLMMWKTIGFTKKSIAFIALYVASLVVISFPYVFTDAQGYFWSLQLPIFGNPPGVGPSNPTTFSYDLSQPTRLTTFLGLVKFTNMQSIAVATYPYLNYIFIASYALLLLQVAVGLVNCPRLFVYYVRTILLSFKWMAWRLTKKNLPPLKSYLASEQRPEVFHKTSLSGTNLLLYCFLSFLLFFAFFGRGVYKYYFAGLTPLALPLFSTKIGALIFDVFSMALLLFPREVTPWMAVLLITLVPSLFAGEPRPNLTVEASTQPRL